jgi:hypothetical protein
MKLEMAFYQGALKQSNLSFIVALIASGFAVFFFLGAVALLLWNSSVSSNTATITAIGGTIAALIGGVNFYLYGISSTQFAALQARTR